jgi:hypothetical protein
MHAAIVCRLHLHRFRLFMLHDRGCVKIVVHVPRMREQFFVIDAVVRRNFL